MWDYSQNKHLKEKQVYLLACLSHGGAVIAKQDKCPSDNNLCTKIF